jgi:hypothetical protein
MAEYECICGKVYGHPFERIACRVSHDAQEAMREEAPAPCPTCGEEVPCVPCESREEHGQ